MVFYLGLAVKRIRACLRSLAAAPGRPDDEIGFSPECAYLSSEADLPHPYELILESFYRTKLTQWATLEPDLQYIVRPGGEYANALVGMVQLSVQF